MSYANFYEHLRIFFSTLGFACMQVLLTLFSCGWFVSSRTQSIHGTIHSEAALVPVRELVDTARGAGYDDTIARLLPLLGNFVADSVRTALLLSPRLRLPLATSQEQHLPVETSCIAHKPAFQGDKTCNTRNSSQCCKFQRFMQDLLCVRSRGFSSFKVCPPKIGLSHKLTCWGLITGW